MAILAKAFHGELVPTEAELARREGRDYERASVLLGTDTYTAGSGSKRKAVVSCEKDPEELNRGTQNCSARLGFSREQSQKNTRLLIPRCRELPATYCCGREGNPQIAQAARAWSAKAWGTKAMSRFRARRWRADEAG
jgi:hypothetical protein